MFSGIVEEMGLVTAVRHEGHISQLVVRTDVCSYDVKIGDSIAVNGVCLTVCALKPEGFVFEAMPETLRLTNLGSLGVGSFVNVERSTTALSRLGGHFVQGHVDGIATIDSIEEEGCSIKVWFKKPELYADCYIPKGYIAIDGMSLTLVDVTPTHFSICFIPHTQVVTIVQHYRKGMQVNVEVDHIAKTVAIMLNQRKALDGQYY